MHITIAYSFIHRLPFINITKRRLLQGYRDPELGLFIITLNYYTNHTGSQWMTPVATHAALTSAPCHHGAMSPRRHVTSAPCHLGAMSPRRNVTSAQCHFGAMSPWRNVTSEHCHLAAMSPRNNFTSAQCHLVAMSPRRNVTSPQCHLIRVHREINQVSWLDWINQVSWLD